MRSAKRGLRPDATRRAPSWSRTAHPHDVGPWTRTPFWSAMPPSRTVSTNERVAARWAGSARLCEGAQRPLQNVGGGPATERASVELDDGHELPDGGGREHLLGAEHLGERVDALLDSISAVRPELEDGGPRDPGENPEVERGRVERLSDPPPHVRHRPFENDVVGVDEDRVVRASPLRLGLGGHVHRVARRLDSRQQPRDRGAYPDKRDDAGAPRADLLDPRGDLAPQRETGRGPALRARGPDEP